MGGTTNPSRRSTLPETFEAVVIPRGMESFYEEQHFAPAVRAGGLLFISGQVGAEDDGSMPLDFGTQAENAMRRLESVLTAAGLTTSDLVSITSYHVGPVFPAVHDFVAAKDRYVSAPYPSWTVLGISELAVPDALLEVSAVAAY